MQWFVRLVRGRLELASLFFLQREVHRAIIRVRKARLSYLDLTALVELAQVVRSLETSRAAGVFVEAGCALGGSALVIAAAKSQKRPFFIYDTFDMLPPPSDQDGEAAHQRYAQIQSGSAQGIDGNSYYGYQEDLYQHVIRTFHRFGLPPEEHNLHFVKGLYSDTLFVEQPVALAHIDCDWYDSVRTCLRRIEPRLVSGGVMIIDDYDTWVGCRKAVDEYFADKREHYAFVRRSRLHVLRK